MLLKDFFSRFPDEESCVSYFKEIRQTVRTSEHVQSVRTVKSVS